MTLKHKGQIDQKRTFQQVHGFLLRHGSVKLAYDTNPGAEFLAVASTATKGAHKGEHIIRLQGAGPCYECCWPHVYNCNVTMIGHATRPLVDWVVKQGG